MRNHLLVWASLFNKLLRRVHGRLVGAFWVSGDVNKAYNNTENQWECTPDYRSSITAVDSMTRPWVVLNDSAKSITPVAIGPISTYITPIGRKHSESLSDLIANTDPNYSALCSKGHARNFGHL